MKALDIRSASHPPGFLAGAPFVDRESEALRLRDAIMKRESLLIGGPAGIGKTALVKTVLREIPLAVARDCLYLSGVDGARHLLRLLLQRLYELGDSTLRQQLHAEGVRDTGFKKWLTDQPTSRLKGSVYRAVEKAGYRVFLDHLGPLTHATAKVIKELFWMRHTPVYILARDEARSRVFQFNHFFYWGDREIVCLKPLPRESAAELLESCIHRFGLSRLELGDFREEVLVKSRQVPGAIVKMCSLAGNPRYQSGSRIRITSVYLEYLMTGHDLSVPDPKRRSA